MLSQKIARILNLSFVAASCLVLTNCASPHERVLGLDKPPSVWTSLRTAGPAKDGDASKLEVASKPQPGDVRWWEAFADPVLDDIVARALINSHQLAIADAQVAEAEANARAAGAELRPSIDGVASATRLRDTDAGGIDTVQRAGLQATWDMDIFGVSRHRRAASVQALASSRAQRDQTRVDTIADTTVAYIRLRSVQAQRDLALANADAQQRTSKITAEQREEGAVSDYEVSRAESQLASTRARVTQFDTAIVSAVNEINILCGKMPGTLNRLLETKKSIPVLPLHVIVSQPAAVLAQRPDLQRADFDLREAAELSKSASLEVFPRISLSAFLGYEHSNLTNSFSPWNAAGNLAAPIFNFGRIQSRINASSARELAAFHTYRQSMISAVAEVENALAAYLNEQRRIAQLSVAASQQARAVDIVEERYRLGRSLQTDLLLTEEDRLEAELALAASRAQASENLVNLYRAMGWGAQAPDASTRALQEIALRRPHASGMQPIVDR